MDLEYDLFERMPDNSLLWQGCATGLEAARQRVRLINRETGHECFAMYMPMKQIVARVTQLNPL